MSSTTATQEGKYIYCIVRSSEVRSFGLLGIGGRGDPLHTVALGDVAAVVSDTPMMRYRVSRENTLAHQKAMEAVMSQQPILPVRFATIAEDEAQVRRILEGEHDCFKSLLDEVSDKIELGVKVGFTESIYGTILAGHERIRTLKEKIAIQPAEQTHYERLRVGQMVEEALQAEKNRVADDVLNVLSPLAAQVRTNDTYGELMILNAAFFVRRQREADFDLAVQELSDTYGQSVKFKYVGSMPPFNFVNLTIQLEKY
jgi:hypothetical protein